MPTEQQSFSKQGYESKGLGMLTFTVENNYIRF